MEPVLITKSSTKHVYRDGGKAIKVFHQDFPKTEVLNEALITARVEETGGIDVAKILEVGVYQSRWSISFEFIEGKSLQTLFDENPDHLLSYMEQMVDLQLKILSKKCPLLNKLKDKMNKQILDVEELTDSARYEISSYLEQMPRHTKLCHGDFNPSNILVRPDGSWCVIDWGHATQGNGSADAARTYLLFCLKDQKKGELYLDMYCKKTNTDKKYVQAWIPIVAAAQLSKKRPDEADLLHQWVKQYS